MCCLHNSLASLSSNGSYSRTPQGRSSSKKNCLCSVQYLIRKVLMWLVRDHTPCLIQCSGSYRTQVKSCAQTSTFLCPSSTLTASFVSTFRFVPSARRIPSFLLASRWQMKCCLCSSAAFYRSSCIRHSQAFSSTKFKRRLLRPSGYQVSFPPSGHTLTSSFVLRRSYLTSSASKGSGFF